MCSSVPTPPYPLSAYMNLRRRTCCLLVHLSASSQPTVATGCRDYNRCFLPDSFPTLPLREAECDCMLRLCAMCACSSINNTLITPVFR